MYNHRQIARSTFENHRYRIVPSRWATYVDDANLHGYYEHDAQGEGGELWFERRSDGKLELTDFDGRYELPKSVARTLREAGYVVDATFD
jgi:hypothetical protein